MKLYYLETDRGRDSAALLRTFSSETPLIRAKNIDCAVLRKPRGRFFSGHQLAKVRPLGQ